MPTRRLRTKSTSKLGWIAPVCAALVLLSSCSAAPRGAGAQARDRRSGDSFAPSAASVVNGRFVKTVKLDGGAITVTPAPLDLHTRSKESSLATEVWATSRLLGYQAQSLGFGLVTISMHAAGVPSVRNIPAWVGLARAGAASSCPMISSGMKFPKLPALPSAGEAAAIIGDSTGSPAVAYKARNAPCGFLVKATLENATESLSLPWIESSPPMNGSIKASATVPACSSFAGIGQDGTRQTTTISLYALRLEDTSTASCVPEHVITETISLGPVAAPGAPPVPGSTVLLHGPTGPQRVTLGAYVWPRR